MVDKRLEQLLKGDKNIFKDLIMKASKSDVCVNNAIAEYMCELENYKYCLDCENETYNIDFPCYKNLSSMPIEETYKLSKIVDKYLSK